MRIRNKNLNGTSTTCEKPTIETIKEVQNKILNISDNLDNLYKYRDEFQRILNTNTLPLNMLCLNLSMYRHEDYWYNNFKMLKPLKGKISFTRIIMCKWQFVKEGLQQMKNAIPVFQAKYNEYKMMEKSLTKQYKIGLEIYQECLVAEGEYMEKEVILKEAIVDVVEAKTDLATEKTGLTEARTELSQAELDREVAVLDAEKNKYMPFILGGVGLGALYLLTKNKKKKRR